MKKSRHSNPSEFPTPIREQYDFWRRYDESCEKAEAKVRENPEYAKIFIIELARSRDSLAADLRVQHGVEFFIDKEAGRVACNQSRPLTPSEEEFVPYLALLWRCWNAALFYADGFLTTPSTDIVRAACRAIEVLKDLPAFELPLLGAKNQVIREKASISISGFARGKISTKRGTRLRKALELDADTPRAPVSTLLEQLPGQVLCTWSERQEDEELSKLIQDLPRRMTKAIIDALRSESHHDLKKGRRVVSLDARDGENGIGPVVEDSQAISGEELLLREEAKAEDTRILKAAKKNMTPREREFLELLLQGIPRPEMAKRLGIKAVTVRGYLLSIRKQISNASKQVS